MSLLVLFSDKGDNMLYIKTVAFCLYALVGIGFYCMITMCFQTVWEEPLFLNKYQHTHWIDKLKHTNFRVKNTFIKGLFVLLTIEIYLINPLPFNDFQNFIVMLLVGVMMIVDLLTMRIPNTIVVWGLSFALIFLFFNVLFLQQDIRNYLFGFLMGGLSLLILALLTNTLGGGDVKLMAFLGLFVGFRLIVWIIMWSFFLAGIAGVILLMTSKKKRKDYMPFGPFIALATLTMLYLNI